MKILKYFVCMVLILIMSIFCYSKNSGVSAENKLNKEDTMTDTQQFKQVRASHLLVQTEEEAKKLREEIIAGKPFAEVAKEVSMCPSGKQGGDLGYFGRGRMVPEFDQAAFSLPVGEISEPIKTQFGWHLLVVTDHR